MEYNTFTNQIKNTLLHETHLVDITTLNKAIHAKKDKKRRFLIFLFSGLVIAALVSSLMIGDKNTTMPATIASSEPRSNEDVQKSILIPNLDNTTTETLIAQNNDANDINVSKSSTTITKNKNSNMSSLKNQSSFTPSSKSSFQNSTSSADIFVNTTYTAIAENQNNQSSSHKQFEVDYLPGLEYNISSLTKSIGIKEDIICPSFKNKSKLNFSLIPELGLILPQKSLSRNFGEASNLIEMRNKNEKSLMGYQAALYGMLSKPGLPISLKVGLSYSTFSERMRLDYSFTKLDTTIGIISITKSQTGDTITTIYGDVTSQKRISGSKVIHHTVSSIDIPIGLNVSKRLGAFTLSGGAGVYLNLSTSVTGRVIVSDTSFTATDAPVARFRSNVGLSYYGELLLIRSLGRSGSIYLGARYRYIPQRFSSPTNEVNQNYSIQGMNLGYIYSL